MTIFERPNNLESNIKFGDDAPWLSKTHTFEPLPERMEDEFGQFGVDKRNRAQSAKSMLNFVQLVLAPINIVGFLGMFGGLILIASALPGKHSRKASPLIADSSLVSIVVGVGCIVVAIVLWFDLESIVKKRNEIFKRDIVRQRLQTCFDVTDYVYNQVKDENIGLASFLESLHIKDSAWNRFSYNDYFRGTYRHTPFIFFDCKLMNHIDAGRNSTDYTLFQGQIILVGLNQNLTDAQSGFCTFIKSTKNLSEDAWDSATPEIQLCNVMEDSVSELLSGKLQLLDPLPVEQIVSEPAEQNVSQADEYIALKSQLKASQEKLDAQSKELAEAENMDPEELSEKQARIDRLRMDLMFLQNRLNARFGLPIELPIDAHNETETPSETSDSALLGATDDDNPAKNTEDAAVAVDTLAILKDKMPVLNKIQQAAQCDAGFVFSGNKLAIILQNDFDPFEFRGRDIFCSYHKLSQRVDAQVSWLWSIFRQLDHSGWID